MFTGGTVRLENPDVAGILAQAATEGVRVYVLRDIADRDGFFHAMRAQFPQDPVLVSNRSWDALLDSIRGGLHDDEPRRVAIVWPDPHTMAGADDRELAMSILGSIARDLADYRATVGKPTELTVILGVAPR